MKRPKNAENGDLEQIIPENDANGFKATVRVKVRPVIEPRLLPSLLASIFTVALSTYLITQQDNGSNKHDNEGEIAKTELTASYPLTKPTIPFDPTKEYKTLEMADIEASVEFHDETYMDTLIRYLGGKHEVLDDKRYAEIRESVAETWKASGLSVSEEFIDGHALTYAYSEILLLATGNITYKAIDEQVATKELTYGSYYVQLNDGEKKSKLKALRKILEEEQTIDAIEKRLRADGLWDSVTIDNGYNTLDYMASEFQEITDVDVGEVIENNRYNYVAKLLNVETVSRATLIPMYVQFYSYDTYVEALNTYMEQHHPPYRLKADLRTKLDTQTAAYKTYMNTIKEVQE